MKKICKKFQIRDVRVKTIIFNLRLLELLAKLSLFIIHYICILVTSFKKGKEKRGEENPLLHLFLHVLLSFPFPFPFPFWMALHGTTGFVLTSYLYHYHFYHFDSWLIFFEFSCFYSLNLWIWLTLKKRNKKNSCMI